MGFQKQESRRAKQGTWHAHVRSALLYAKQGSKMSGQQRVDPVRCTTTSTSYWERQQQKSWHCG